MPLTMTAFFIGALSVIGLPPCGGFISKWHLVIGNPGGRADLLSLCPSGQLLLNAAYFLPIFYKAFFCTDEEAMFERQVDEAPSAHLVPVFPCASRLPVP